MQKVDLIAANTITNYCKQINNMFDNISMFYFFSRVIIGIIGPYIYLYMIIKLSEDVGQGVYPVPVFCMGIMLLPLLVISMCLGF